MQDMTVKMKSYERLEAYASREIAIGTAQGVLISVSFEEKEKKERGGKPFVDLSATGEPIRGLAQLPMGQDRLLLLVSSTQRLHAFHGPNSLDKLGGSYQSPESKLQEAPAGPESLSVRTMLLSNQQAVTLIAGVTL